MRATQRLTRVMNCPRPLLHCRSPFKFRLRQGEVLHPLSDDEILSIERGSQSTVLADD
jgi:hypothetical protein